MTRSTTARPPNADSRVVMHMPWSDFESFLAHRGDRGPRVTYAKGTLELMSPSSDHESIKKRIAAVLEAFMDHAGIRYEGLGSWLLKHEPSRIGLEPDECYVLAAGSKPRPDLALEVVWTHGGRDKLSLYHPLGVPEVWVWSDGALAFHAWRTHGYEPLTRSELLPDFDPALVDEALTLPTLSDARRMLRERLR